MENRQREGQLPEAVAHAVEIDFADAAGPFLAPKSQGLIAIQRLRRRLPRFEQRILQLRHGEILEQLRASDQFHRQRPLVAENEELVEAGELRMAQLREITKLAFET